MTPASPSSSDGQSLPPRHRPNVGNLSKDTTESDLWDFDDLDSKPSPPKKVSPSLRGPTARKKGEVPLPRQDKEQPPPAKISDASEGVNMNVGQQRPRVRAKDPLPAPSKAGHDFDELDHWEEPSAPAGAPPPALEAPIPSAPAAEAPAPAAAPEPDLQPEPAAAETPAAPVSLKPRLNLSKVERIGLVALAVLLLVGAVGVLVYSLGRLPTQSMSSQENDFPVKGQHLSINGADTYWRAPIVDGANPDMFRRGTVLLPVLELAVGSGSGALRVVFRNGEGESVGDVVTRSVRGGQTLEIPATAGFDDVGMHAAYRTGDGKPWSIQLFEASSVDAPSGDFKWLCKITISTDLR